MNKRTCDILIRNGQVVTVDSERRIFSPGAVAITGSCIVEVGADSELLQRFDAKQTVDAEGGIVHPGFIDAHNHVVHTSCRGVFANVRDSGSSSVNFADWKAGVTDEDEAAATAMAGLEMLRCGFTMFIEPGSLFSTDAAAQGTAKSRAMRCATCRSRWWTQHRSAPGWRNSAGMCAVVPHQPAPMTAQRTRFVMPDSVSRTAAFVKKPHSRPRDGSRRYQKQAGDASNANAI